MIDFSEFSKATRALHAGYDFDTQRTMSVPIYQNTAFSFESSEQARARFGLEELGNIYARLTSPTVDVLASRLASVEGGAFGTITSSGSAAIFYAIVNLAQNGENILFSNKIYGGSQTLFTYGLKRFGIEGRVFDIDNPSSIESLIDDKTRAIFFESLSNPQIVVADVEAITQIAKKHKIITICDNTVATPFLFKPFSHGVDISVHSLSKYINGHGSGLGGAIIERAGLNDLIVNNPRYKAFNEPDPSYHGLVYASLKDKLPIFSIRILTEWLRNIGATISPQNAWLHIQGLETLELRIKKHSDNALAVAEFLSTHSKIKSVNYPGLKNDKYYQKAQKYLENGSSGLLSFEAESEKEARKICDNLKLFEVVANIGDSKSLIIHPYSTTHSQLSKEELQSAGITPNTVRISIGLENADDLIADLKRAIEL